ncbi:hypothetical protein [Jiella marina]|uniref:hypothetical protein n=1 Tax=Jiella sp. LLJ827 TaxID=2917712 RepID=UPI0021014D7F|nr:hypothetical protein [Jiella sp. LLJ827]MCQ0986436.1 hypothetical protein [Jiella sp. LLJ827]
MTMTYDDIIQRIADATEPNRELDCRVYAALYGYEVSIEEHRTFGRQVVGRRMPESNWWMDHPDSPVPNFTASADAVKTEAERQVPGVFYHAAKGRIRAGEPLYAAVFLFGTDEALGAGEHDTGEAFSLLLALFRSLKTVSALRSPSHSTPHPEPVEGRGLQEAPAGAAIPTEDIR